jgi:hypothetical protein
MSARITSTKTWRQSPFSVPLTKRNLIVYMAQIALKNEKNRPIFFNSVIPAQGVAGNSSNMLLACGTVSVDKR